MGQSLAGAWLIVYKRKLADLVLVAGNPLDDVDLLCNPESVHLVLGCEILLDTVVVHLAA